MAGVENICNILLNDGTELEDYLAGDISHTIVKVAVINSTSDITDNRDVVVSSLHIIATATETSRGMMSADDKAKLNGVAAGAQVNVETNLGTTATSTTRTVTSSTGDNVTLPAATTSEAGVMTAADRSKLNGVAAGAQVNVATNLGTSATSTTRTVTSSTGGNVTLPAATTSEAGVMTAADRSKMNGIEAGATGDQTAAEILALLKTVDGAGSGLDADTVDGMHASSFLTGVTSSAVGDAVAELSVGSKGTYALLFNSTIETVAPGVVRSGSTLRYASTFSGDGNYYGGGSIAPSGSWECMGYDGARSGLNNYTDNNSSTTIWKRKN